MYCFLIYSILLLNSVVIGSDIGALIGDGAISQIIRHVAQKVLENPRSLDVTLQTKEDPYLGPIGSFEVLNTLNYSNLSVVFHKEIVHLHLDRLLVDSHSHLPDILWPFGLADQSVFMKAQVDSGDIILSIDDNSLSISKCQLSSPSLDISIPDHWFSHQVANVFSYLLSPFMHTTVCSLFHHFVGNIEYHRISQLDVYELIPEKARNYLSSTNTTLFYRLTKIDVRDKQMTLNIQLEWEDINPADPVSSLLDGSSSNSSLFNIELSGKDEITIWIQDDVINSLIQQVDWTFEWMNEKIAVSSPVIPPDSREFLSTLCTECYFQVNVAARGEPVFSATNNSLVLEKRDRVHLQVVNPNRNVTSVFVSFILTIEAELRPSFDDGVLRTQVQLLDTNIEMENGAFPKNWGLFMQDLMRGMIMDMLWPEIKNAIEELSYGKGVRLSRACGIDPYQMKITIGEGDFALTSKLLLEYLEPDECLKELKKSLPNTSKLFPKVE